MTREQFDAAFLAAIDKQASLTPHTHGWKPLIDLVWEELSMRHEAIALGPEKCDHPGSNIMLNVVLGTEEWYCMGCGACHLEPACKYRKSVPTLPQQQGDS